MAKACTSMMMMFWLRYYGGAGDDKSDDKSLEISLVDDWGKTKTKFCPEGERKRNY